MDQLEGEILQYESQLAQVRLAISELEEGPQKTNLIALETDLEELINLSKIKVSELSNVQNECTSNEDPFDKEYNLFKAEISGLEVKKDGNSSKSKPETSRNDSHGITDLKDDLDGLKGTKCQAPFTYKWTNDVTYHNAFISQVPELDEINEYDEIKVKVMFMNPTHKEMLPCPYYLEGECKFSDNKCRYSHGELVLLSSLRDYSEPVFSKLCEGCKVFAKQDDGLWYRAHVISVDNTNCNVKFESNSKEECIPFHNILPLGLLNSNDDLENAVDLDNDSNSSKSILVNDEEETIKRILSSPPGSALGEWEKFTKGFGSKIMAKMGYIHGSGLGKDGLGRVEPVSAVILPAGKSLDHCMMLKEKAGNDKDLFKVEKKMKYFQKKHEEKLKRDYENAKNKRDIFTFLNNKLESSAGSVASKVPSVSRPLKNETIRNLNVTGLQLTEEMRKVEREIKSLNQSLTRHSNDSHTFNIIKEKLAFKQNRLSELHASERKIRTEQDQRRDRQKLTIF